MDWQLLLVMILVGVAGLYVLQASWQTWFGKRQGCGGKCSCPAEKSSSTAQPDKPEVSFIPLEQFGLRKRS